MTRRLNDLHVRRGRLLERIAAQRTALVDSARPVSRALYRADHVVGQVRSVADYLRRHPGLAVIPMVGLFFVKRERLLRYARRGFVVWQTWRALRNRLFVLRARGPS